MQQTNLLGTDSCCYCCDDDFELPDNGRRQRMQRNNSRTHFANVNVVSELMPPRGQSNRSVFLPWNLPADSSTASTVVYDCFAMLRICTRHNMFITESESGINRCTLVALAPRISVILSRDSIDLNRSLLSQFAVRLRIVATLYLLEQTLIGDASNVREEHQQP